MLLILLQIGLPLLSFNWIMGCVSIENFYVLINGSPLGFFGASRGIRQGFPLSPLLFLLIIEGLSHLIGKAKSDGKIYGIKLSPSLVFSHLLFVDDAIIFGMGTLEEWKEYKEILNLFCVASGMRFNLEKYYFLSNYIFKDTSKVITDILPYKMDLIDKGFKYMGFWLKHLGYVANDWHWITHIFE